jgi:hypothetical protein
MNFVKKYYCLIPLLLIIAETTVNLTVNFNPTLNPFPPQNDFQNSLLDYLRTAQLNPLDFNVRDFQNEVDFYLQNPDKHPFTVILSTQKDALKQVAALQNVIKIANMKGDDLKFIDLSSSRPYATF